MDRTLTSFIASLRNVEVRISPAETLDAMNAVELTGYRDREFLKNTLALVLPKTADEKETFENTFESFFSFRELTGDQEAAEGEGSSEDGETEGEGQANGEGGSVCPRMENQSGKKSKFSAVEIDEEVEVLEPGKCPSPRPISASYSWKIVALN